MEFQILDYIQTLRTPVLDVIMKFITTLGNGGFIWIAIALCLLMSKKTRRIGNIVAVALAFDGILCNVLIKPIVARIRPYDVNTAIFLAIKQPTDYSFPSGHTAIAFAATSALFWAGEKKMGIVALILACLIAFSRLYFYVHYPTDILGGVIIGTLCGWLGFIVVSFLTKNRLNKNI